MPDRIDSFIDLVAIEAEKTKLIAALREISAEMGNIPKQATGMKDVVTSLNQIDTATKKLQKTAKELTDEQLKEAEIKKQLNAERRKEAAALANGTAEWNKHLKAQRDAGNAYREIAKAQGLASDAAQKALANYKRLRDETDKVNESMGNHQANVGNYKSALKGLTSMFAPIVAGVLSFGAALEGVKAVINSTDSSADKFERTMEGMRQSWGVLLRAFATGDFSNLITNMNNAAEAGMKYADVLDDLTDRARALEIQDARSRTLIIQQLKILRDRTATEQERIAAAKKVIELEDINIQKKVKNAKINMDAEINLAKQYGLSGDMLVKLIANYDDFAGIMEKAKKNSDILASAQAQLSSSSKGMSLGMGGGVIMETTKKIDEQIESTKKLTQNDLFWIDVWRKFGSIPEEARQKLTDSIVTYTEATNARAEAELDVISRMSSLMVREEKHDLQLQKAAQTAEEKAAKDKDLIAIEQLKNTVLTTSNYITDQQIEKYVESTAKANLNAEAVKKLTEDIKDFYVENEAGDFGKAPFEALLARDLEALGKYDELFAKLKELAIDTGGEILKGLGTQAFEDQIARMDDELTSWHEKQLAQLEERKESGIISDKEYQAAKLRLDKEYEAKQRKTRNEQAKIKKEEALWEIAINTAVAFSKSLTKDPTGVLGLYDLALGAAQAAIVLAQPIPKYKTGTDNHPGGMAVIGDDGREAVVLPSGETFVTPDRATLAHLPVGTKVIPNINTFGGLQPMNQSTTLRAETLADEKLDAINATLKGLPITTLNITENGIYAATKRGNNIEVHLNTNVRL